MIAESDNLLAAGMRVLEAELKALQNLADSLDESFVKACELILACEGRVIVTGMGKSGHIGQKITASLTSTGTVAHFLHPAEGVHGDLGVIHRGDLLLAISYSGETAEILHLLGPVTHVGIPIIAITGQRNSTLGNAAEVVLVLGDAKEADSNNIVPTTSTTLTLALGDALTIALMEARGFSPEDFAVFHPMGSLGKRLTLKVRDLLRADETNPVVPSDAQFGKALEVITHFALGGTSVVDEQGKLIGILTDGDVRRIMSRFAAKGGTVSEVITTPVSELMITDPTLAQADSLAYDALKLMENHQPRPVFILPIVDSLNRPVGMLHLHALVQAGFKVKSRPD